MPDPTAHLPDDPVTQTTHLLTIPSNQCLMVGQNSRWWHNIKSTSDKFDMFAGSPLKCVLFNLSAAQTIYIYIRLQACFRSIEISLHLTK